MKNKITIVSFIQGDTPFNEALAEAVLRKQQEEFLRLNDATVRNAWNQYQMVLALRLK